MKPAADPLGRLMSKVHRDPNRSHNGVPCWIYEGQVGDDGYGRFWRTEGKTVAHKAAYELIIGPVPTDLTLDHLCRNRGCVNPLHLEPVTRGENVLRGMGISAQKARQTHCKRGHPLSGRNLYTNTRGHRRCRTCTSLDQKARRKRKRGES